MHTSMQSHTIQETVIKASVGHRSFGQLLRKTHIEDQRTIIEHDGFPVAVLLPYRAYKDMKSQLAFQALDDLHSDLSLDPTARSLTENQLIQEIRKTRKRLFTPPHAQST